MFLFSCVLLYAATGIFGLHLAQPSPRQKQPTSTLAQARAALLSGNPEEAIRLLSSHVQNHPQDLSARSLLGQAYVATGQDGQAQEQYENVLRSSPENYSALAGLGEIYERAGDLTRAEPLLARAAELSQGDAH
ncbi:MAG: tetratricopeptide repeat protein, partial [Acidobacteria bacterium]|nr:tetratricopeptide repeat protein [Acidobacteriota bacterium]